MKKFIFLLILSLPAFALGQGIHGNNFTVSSGWTFGDTDLEGLELDSDWFSDFRINYFVSNEFYLTSGIGLSSATYKDDGTLSGNLIARITGNNVSFGLGVGYESRIDDSLAVFTEGGFIVGTGNLDAVLFGGNRVSFDTTTRRAAASFGVRGKVDNLLTSLSGSLFTSVIDYDLAGLDDVTSSGISLNGYVTYNIFENVNLGLAADTDFEIHFIGLKSIITF